MSEIRLTDKLYYLSDEFDGCMVTELVVTDNRNQEEILAEWDGVVYTLFQEDEDELWFKSVHDALDEARRNGNRSVLVRYQDRSMRKEVFK